MYIFSCFLVITWSWVHFYMQSSPFVPQFGGEYKIVNPFTFCDGSNLLQYSNSFNPSQSISNNVQLPFTRSSGQFYASGTLRSSPLEKIIIQSIRIFASVWMMLNFCNIICLIIIIATDDLFAGLWDSTVSEVDMLQLPIFCLVNLSCQSLGKLYYYYHYHDNNDIDDIIVNLSCQSLRKLLLFRVRVLGLRR